GQAAVADVVGERVGVVLRVGEGLDDVAKLCTGLLEKLGVHLYVGHVLPILESGRLAPSGRAATFLPHPGAPGRFSPWGELPLVAAQPGEVAPLALGGSAGAALTDRDGRLLDLRRGRRGLVDHRLGGDRSADALAQRPLDD